MMFSKRDLIKLLGPLIVEQILAVLVGMVDVVISILKRHYAHSHKAN